MNNTRGSTPPNPTPDLPIRSTNSHKTQNIPHHVPKRKVSKPSEENRQEKAPKITKKGNREELKQALRNVDGEFPST
jgi:hypothetical protein